MKKFCLLFFCFLIVSTSLKAEPTLGMSLTFQQRTLLPEENINPVFQYDVFFWRHNEIQFGILANYQLSKVQVETHGVHYAISNFFLIGPQVLYTFFENRSLAASVSVSPVLVAGRYRYSYTSDTVRIGQEPNVSKFENDTVNWGLDISTRFYYSFYRTLYVGVLAGITPSSFTDEDDLMIGLGHFGVIIGKRI